MKVDSQLKTGPAGDAILYQIEKENKHKVTAVHLTGNKNIPASKLDPSIAVEKKRSFFAWKISAMLLSVPALRT